MTRLIKVCIVLAGLCFGAHVNAEGGCPPGEYPFEVSNVVSCIPIPGYYAQADRARAHEQAQRQRHDAKLRADEHEKLAESLAWGALAITSDYAAVGSSARYASEEDARRNALSKCERSDCHVIATFKRQCAAFVTSKGKSVGVGIAPTFEESARIAMHDCNRQSAGGRCELWAVPTCSGMNYADLTLEEQDALLKTLRERISQ